MCGFIREHAVVEDLPPITVAAVRGAARAMKAKAGLGIDRLSPVDVERLPDAALEELCDLYHMIEEGLSWPWQVLTCVGRLLGKKAGGEKQCLFWTGF